MRESIELALIVSRDRGDDQAAKRFRAQLDSLPAQTRINTFVALTIIIAVALALIAVLIVGGLLVTP